MKKVFWVCFALGVVLQAADIWLTYTASELAGGVEFVEGNPLALWAITTLGWPTAIFLKGLMFGSAFAFFGIQVHFCERDGAIFGMAASVVATTLGLVVVAYGLGAVWRLSHLP
jgi:hypothetical protein